MEKPFQELDDININEKYNVFSAEIKEQDKKKLIFHLVKPNPEVYNGYLEFTEEDVEKVKSYLKNAGKWETYKQLHAELHSK